MTDISNPAPQDFEPRLRIVFAGTPEFARVALERICTTHNTQQGNLQVVGVLTQPDRPAGRGLKLQASAVKTYALEQNIPLMQPRSLRLDGKFGQDAQDALNQLKIWRPDVMIVAAYGLILPAWALETPPMGCLNIHASLLPRWRGAAPIHRAIEAGDKETGVCIMQMDAGLDTGGILATQSCPILPVDTTDSLHDRLANLGADLLVTSLKNIKSLQAIPQNSQGISYAHKIEKLETWVDWAQSARAIELKLRAFSSLPGLQTHVNGEVFKIWGGHALDHQRLASHDNLGSGTILQITPEGVDVACAESIFRITQIQRAGGKRMPLQAFILGSALQSGDRFAVGPLNPIL